MQASAAAASVSTLLAPARNTLVEEKTYPEEKVVSGEEPRIGVFVCHCGINIGSVVNVPAVVEAAKELPYVVHTQDYLYACSQDSQTAIKEIIAQKGLNRVVVASCSPRTHRPLFQETLREAGLNRHLFEMANIRDQCSWVHMNEPEKATEKAIDLVKAAVGKAALLKPVKQHETTVTKTALVIGGGVAGLTAALEIANQGFRVEVVEKSGQLGGMAANIWRGFQGENIPSFLEKLISQVQNHPLINVSLREEIVDVSGHTGNFTSVLRSGREIKHGVTIVATGGDEYKPVEYLYGEDERVVTQLELEKLLRDDQTREKVR
ncbi:MAG: CoB--CoM heterodisulfide reductase iron-sulfur subunit A family protein, partial [Desulfofundulus sp.]